MDRPTLVQYLDLTAEHFASHPVWVGVHGIDDGEPWYEDTDEETFRPWLGVVPVTPTDAMYLVQATFTLADGTVLPGFVIPQEEAKPPHRLVAAVRRLLDRPSPGAQRFRELLQAEFFLPTGRREQFWDGTISVPPERRDACLADLARRPDDVFPVTVAAVSGLTRGKCTAVFRDF